MTSRNKSYPSKTKASKAQNLASVTLMTMITNSLRSQKTKKPMMRLLSFSKKISAFNFKTKRGFVIKNNNLSLVKNRKNLNQREAKK